MPGSETDDQREALIPHNVEDSVGDESKRRAKAKVMDTIASSEVMDSPFAHLPKEEAESASVDPYADIETSSSVSVPSRSRSKASNLSSEVFGSSLVSTPSLPWSELSFSTGISRGSMNGGRSALGDSGALQGGRTFESFPSTRTSSMAVPSIPEGMERLSSGPTPDHMPSPFSNPDLQTDALAEETKPGSGAMDPQAPADNGFGQGLKSLSGSEANLYLQLTDELASDPELADLLIDQAKPEIQSRPTFQAEACDMDGPSKELIDKLRNLLPGDDLNAFLCQMSSDVSARRQQGPAPAGPEGLMGIAGGGGRSLDVPVTKSEAAASPAEEKGVS